MASTMKKTSATHGRTKKKPAGGTGKTPTGGTGKPSVGWIRNVVATVIPVPEIPDAIRVERRQGREWAFGLAPDNPDFEAGCELLESSQPRKAQAMFERALKRNPRDIDTLHHLAVVLDQAGKADDARRLWTDAVRLGREAIPAGFQKGRDRLQWGWLENRPYLRALHGLGCSHLGLGKKADALAIFEELLNLNPDDNQGVRELALEQYLEAGQLDKARELVNIKYKDDAMAGLLYGRPLVLFKTGDRKGAEKELKDALRLSPKIAQELLKTSHRRPINELPGYITMGGWDEAFEYWTHFGRFWDKDALDWLRDIAAKTEIPTK
jgi:tetratricopeptide (TPR) repeat protein